MDAILREQLIKSHNETMKELDIASLSYLIVLKYADEENITNGRRAFLNRVLDLLFYSAPDNDLACMEAFGQCHNCKKSCIDLEIKIKELREVL